MGLEKWRVLREIKEQEERFEQLRLMGRFAKGQREQEPLPGDVKDEA